MASYGSYQSFWVYLMVTSTIACGGLAVLVYTYNIATIRYILSGLKRHYYLLYGLFSLLMGGVFFVLLQKEMAGSSSGLSPLALVYFLCYSWNIILEAILIIARKFRLLLLLSVLHAAGFCWVHYFVAQKTFDLSLLISLLALLSALRFAFMLQGVIKTFSASKATDARPIHMKRVYSMWLSLLTYDTTQIIFRFLDKFIITFLVAKELAAIYMNGTIDIPFLPVLFAAVGNAALIQLTKVGQKDKNFTAGVIRQSSVSIAGIAIPMFCYLLVFRNELMVFVFSEKYVAAAPIFAISILKLLTYLFTLPFFLQYRQRGDLLNKGAVLDMACSLLLVFPLYYWLGLNGLILSFVISSFIQVFYYAWCTTKLLKVGITAILPLKNWGLKAIVFFGLSAGNYYLWSGLLSNFLFLLVTGCILAAIALLWLFVEYKRAGITTFAARNKTVQDI